MNDPIVFYVDNVVREVKEYYKFSDVILGGLSLSIIYKLYNKLPFFTDVQTQRSDFLQEKEVDNLQYVIEYYGLTPEKNNIDIAILKQMAVRMTKDASYQRLNGEIALTYRSVKHMMDELKKHGSFTNVLNVSDLEREYKKIPTGESSTDPFVDTYRHAKFHAGGNKSRRQNKRTHKKRKTKKHM